MNRDKAKALIALWEVDAIQGRYSDSGTWYAALSHFPAALFDAHGYLRFDTEEEYKASLHIIIRKQIRVRRPGISSAPNYVRMLDEDIPINLDLDIHVANEGQQRLVTHLRRERNRSIVDKKKKQAASHDCEICGFSFGSVYGNLANDYCEVHHLIPLSEVEHTTQTRMKDLAIVCANCHRVVHLKNPPYTIAQVKDMLPKPK